MIKNDIKAGSINTMERLFDFSLLLYFCAFLIFNNDQMGDVTHYDSIIRNGATFLVLILGSWHVIKQHKSFISKLLYFKAYALFVLFGLASALWAESINQVLTMTPSMIRILLLSVFLAARINDKSGFKAVLNVYILSALIKIIFVGQMMYSYYGNEMIWQRFGHYFGYNPNDIAVMCVCAIAFLMLKIVEDKEYSKRFFEIAIVILLVVIVFLTQSKKGFIGILLLPIFYSFYNYETYRRHMPILLASIILLLVLFNSALFTEISEGALDRMEALWSNSAKDGSTIMREKLINMAIDIWKDNPIIGIGLNNFSLHSGVAANYYSHNNYTEILSGLGIIGILLYYFPIARFLHIIKRKWKSPISSISLMLKSLVLVLLFLDVGNVSYSSFNIQIVYILLSLCAYYCITSNLLSKNRGSICKI